MAYNQQQHGKILGGSKSKPRENNNSNVYRQPTFADIMGIQEGTGGVYSPIAPDPYTGLGSTTQYEEPVYSDFGMTPQAPREGYFGPTNWEPGIGNEYHQPSALASYEAAVASTIDKPILDSKSIKKQIKKYSGPREQWTPGAGNDEYQPNIVDAVTSSDTLKEAPSYDGHPSAGDFAGIDTSSASLEDLLFEQFGESTLYPDNDTQLTAPTFGKYFGSAEQPFVPSGATHEGLTRDIQADLDRPYGDPIFTSSGYKEPLKADQGLIDATNGLVLEDDDYRVLDKQGVFEEFIHGGRSIADAGFNLTDEGLAGLNQTAIGLMTNPSGVPSYAASLDRYNGHPSAGVTYPQPPQYNPNRESLTYKGSAPQSIYDLAVSSGQAATAANEAAKQEQAARAAMLDQQGSVYPNWPRAETVEQKRQYNPWDYEYLNRR